MPASLDDVTWPVRTERLTIRRATLDDGEATWAFRQLADVARWITSAPATLEEHLEKWSKPEGLQGTMIMLRGDQIIGDLMLAVRDPWAQSEVVDQAKGQEAELGWTIDPRFGGQGYATEAVGGLIELAFGTLGLRRLTALCFADNAPSWRLMERHGMRREAHNVQDSLHRDLGWIDGYAYALLAEEWLR